MRSAYVAFTETEIMALFVAGLGSWEALEHYELIHVIECDGCGEFEPRLTEAGWLYGIRKLLDVQLQAPVI